MIGHDVVRDGEVPAGASRTRYRATALADTTLREMGIVSLGEALELKRSNDAVLTHRVGCASVSRGWRR